MTIFNLLRDHSYIQLNQLLKIINLVESGGEANQVITSGEVKVNKEVEFQKRKKLYPGDEVEFNGIFILIKTFEEES